MSLARFVALALLGFPAGCVADISPRPLSVDTDPLVYPVAAETRLTALTDAEFDALAAWFATNLPCRETACADGRVASAGHGCPPSADVASGYQNCTALWPEPCWGLTVADHLGCAVATYRADLCDGAALAVLDEPEHPCGALAACRSAIEELVFLP